MILIFLLTGFLKQKSYSQNDTLKKESIFKLTVENDILNLPVEGFSDTKIYSSSRSLERSFKASLSSSVITNEAILKSGATNIPEVLKLVPGMMVNQITNGNYQVAIRAGTNLPVGNYLSGNDNSNDILVLIDNVPFIDHFTGEIIWKSIPVDLVDIERIEVVRGGVSALYGNNAYSGVINIITKGIQSRKVSGEVNLKAGSPQSIINNASGNVSLNKDLSLRVSAYYHQLNRFQDEYYTLNSQKFIISDSLLFYQPNAHKTNKYTENSKQKYGGIAYLKYEPKEDFKVNMAFSLQKSLSQGINLTTDTLLALVMRETNSNMLNLNAKIYDLFTNISIANGTNEYGVDYSGTKYDFKKIFSEFGYELNYKSFNLKPGISIANVNYNNLSYLSNENQIDEEKVPTEVLSILNGRGINPNYSTNKKYSNLAAYLLTDLNLWDKIRLQASARGDSYNNLDKVLFSFLLGSSYYFNLNHNLRISYSISNKSPFVNNFPDNNIDGNQENGYLLNMANRNLELQKLNDFELGYRTKVFQNFQLDLEVFHQKRKNHYQQSSFTENNLTIISQENNLIHAINKGVTLNLDASFSKINFGANFTFQKNKLENIEAGTLNQSLASDIKLNPERLGFFYVNYSPFKNLNFYTNLNYLDNYSIFYRGDVYQINSKLSSNIHLTYQFLKNYECSLSVRNISATNDNEYIFSDTVKPLFLMGLHLNF